MDGTFFLSTANMNLTIYSYKPTGEASHRQPAILLQPVDSHDLEEMETELAALASHAARPFVLVPVPVCHWFDELAPWAAPPVFGKTPFGDGAPATLAMLLDRVLPAVVAANPLRAVSAPGRIVRSAVIVPDMENPAASTACSDSAPLVILGGYSLAGLFALWAGTQHAFSAVAGASPSVWYPDWLDFSASHPMFARAVYLSLGDTEHKSRTPIMATVGDCIRRQLAIVRNQQVPAILEMNPGNHFKDNGLRMARGFAWTMRLDKML